MLETKLKIACQQLCAHKYIILCRINWLYCCCYGFVVFFRNP